MEQYKDRPRFTGVITAIVQQWQDLEDAIYALDAGRQLWNGSSSPAIGAQLDGIGLLVGIPRNGLSDQEYLLFIFGKIVEDFSDTTLPTVLTVVGYLFQAKVVTAQEIFPAGMYIAVLEPGIPTNLFQTAKAMVQNALGAGINLVLAESATVGTFRFNGPGVVGSVNGFGEGVFAGLV